MAKGICTVPDCNRDVHLRGWCPAHYKRVQKYGNPRIDVPLRELPARDERGDIVGRILKRCTFPDSGCIEWTGYTLPSGYGTISWGSRQWVVHRAIWTATVEPIPTDGDWTLDHLCRNRICVNVDHLEVVTRTINSLRGGGIVVAQAKNLTVALCRNGHRYTPENTRTDKRGYRQCVQCERDAWTRQAERINARRREMYRAKREAGVHWREARLVGSG